MSHATAHAPSYDLTASVRKLRHDRLRRHQGKLRLHTMITDVEGVLAAPLAASDNGLPEPQVTGLDTIPTLIVDADRLIEMLNAMLSHAHRQADPSTGPFQCRFSHEYEREELQIELHYYPNAGRRAVDQALEVMLTRFDHWLAATPLEELEADSVDDLPASPDLAEMAWCAMMADAMGGSIQLRCGADDDSVSLLMTIIAPHGADVASYDVYELTEHDLDDPLIAVSSGQGLQPKMVLLIEDAAIASRLVSDYLQQLGHQVHIVDRGGAAFEAVESIVFDVVLVDLTLPYMSGWEVMERLRPYREAEQIGTVYAFTASDDADLPKRVEEAGFDGLLTKPVDWNQLRSLLTNPDDNQRDALEFQKAGYVDDWDLCLGFPLLDGAVRQELISILGEEALEQLQGDFREVLDDYSASLENTRIGAYDQDWYQTCHNMKSMAGSMGATRLSQMAHVLTHYGWPAAADDAATTLRDTIMATRDRLHI